MMGPNMDYCKFENTVDAMRQCIEHLNSGAPIKGYDEQRAFRKMIDIINETIEFYGNDDGVIDDETVEEIIAGDEYYEDAEDD